MTQTTLNNTPEATTATSTTAIPAHLVGNPLVHYEGLIPFDQIKAEHVSPALDYLLETSRKAVAAIESIPAADAHWDNFITGLDKSVEQLGNAWSIVGHLTSVVDTPELRAAHNENEPRMVEFFAQIGQSEALFRNSSAIRARPEFAQLSAVRQKILNNTIRGFRLSGAELPEDKKPEFAALQEKMAALSTKFSENVLDTINDFSLLLTEAEVDGLPQDVRDAAKADAESKQLSGYRFTLHAPSMFPLLQYATDRSVRERIYRATITKASELADNPQWDNTQNIVDILAGRAHEAAMLGFDSFADLSLYTKMAQSPKEVFDFLNDLAQRARPYAQTDYDELKAFAAEQLNLPQVEPWDLAYASEKLREQRYSFSENEVKQYFKEERVINGLFGIVSRLFNVSILRDTATTWHPDVQFYRIERADELIGQFYLDPYARSGKRGGAWMNGSRDRMRRGDTFHTPVAYLICNFTPPLNDKNGVRKPVLLTHDDVVTLFHEFGHGLHHMLTEIDEPAVAGISGVEWDAVELPSQFMENFCWEWEVISDMSEHVDTGAKLPRSLYDKMLQAKNYHSGMQMLRQVEMSLFDMHLHYPQPEDAGKTPQDIINEVRSRVSIMPKVPFNRFQNAFSHIFAGGYAAGYYSYKWAEVLSADAYAAFEESAPEGKPPSDAIETGIRFQSEILAVGGSRPAIDSFRAFRGRDPQIDALLRHCGLDGQPQATA